MVAGKQYLSVEQVARRLSLDAEVVDDLLKARTLPGLQLGSAWLVPESALAEFLEEEFARQNPALVTMVEKRARTPERRKSSGTRTGRMHAVQLTFRGRRMEMPNYAAAVIWVIEEIAEADATFLERLGAVRRGRRRYVARNRDELYVNRPDLPAREMRNRWWIGTNYSRTELEKMLRKACELAGLRFGLDVAIAEAGPSIATTLERAREFVGKGHSGLGDLARRHDHYLTEP
jgi:excisionase family DNA binding protein